MFADCAAAQQFARGGGTKAAAVLRNVRLKWLRHFCHHWYFSPLAKSPLFVALWLEGRVVVEERIYTLQPGKVAEYFRIEADHGADIYLKTMGRVVGVFATEFGALNQIVHMVAFEDLADRTARRCGPIRTGKPMRGRCGH